MRKYIFIGCGGFLGAVLRFAVKNMNLGSLASRLPLGTLAANIAGAFLLAFVMTAAAGAGGRGTDIRLGVTAGLLGAFTTFSALCREAAGLIGGGNYTAALLYVAASAALGFGAACLGYASRMKYEAFRAVKGLSGAVGGSAEPEASGDGAE